MAPRKRPRKSFILRKDAAYNAMQQLGFSDHVISETINELLDVYGQDGWTFVEEFSYRVLLEAILEKGEKQDVEEGGAACGVIVPACFDAEDASGVLVPACFDAEPVSTLPREDPDYAIESNEPLRITLPNSESAEREGSGIKAIRFVQDSESKQGNSNGDEGFKCIEHLGNFSLPLDFLNGRQPSAEGEGSGFKAIMLGQDSESKQGNNNGDEGFKCIEHLGNVSLSPRQEGSNPIWRQRHYYHGWIESGDEGELVHLTPGPLAKLIAEWRSMKRDKPRSKRWDVRPDKPRSSRWDVRPEQM